MNGASFEELGKVQDIAKSWSAGTKSIHELMKDQSTLSEAKVCKVPTS